ncbi:MAG: hypothetical protein R6V86_09730 [Spirochaetia bacterium]
MQQNWNIEEVKEVFGHEKVNQYLRNGWVLLATHVVGEMEMGVPNPPLMYVLGRPKKKDQLEE